MKSSQTNSSLRWFLLLWIGLVYLWELFGVRVVIGDVSMGYTPIGQHPPRGVGVFLPNLLSSIPFSLLMLLYAILLWISFSRKMPRHFSAPYFLTQGLLVLIMNLVVHQVNVTLSLYLALTLGAVGILRRVRYVIMVAGGYSALFLLCVVLNIQYSGHLSNFWFNIWSTFDYMALALFVVGYLAVYLQQVRAQAQLQVAHDQLAASSRRIEELTLLTERQRMARELHDTLAQGLAGVIMQLEVVVAHFQQQQISDAQSTAQQTLLCARETLVEARCAIHDLRADINTTLNLLEDVQEEIERFSHATSIQCEVDLSGLSSTPPHLYEHVSRTIREGLMNVARHAQARKVWVRVIAEDSWLTIEVQDDGHGFDPTIALTRTGHYGLLGLRERARLAQGLLDISSAPGVGTTMRLRLPLHLEAEETDTYNEVSEAEEPYYA